MAPKKPLTKEDKEFTKKFMKTAQLLAAVGIVVFAVVLGSVYTGKLDLTSKGIKLKTVEDRLVFTLKFQSLHLAWIILCIYNVIDHRRGTPAVDPTKGHEHLTEASKNILTNTIEHGLVFMISQMILSIDLEPEMCGRLIPALNLLYLFGRVAFRVGYPSYRTFGFLLSHFSVLYSVGFNLFNLYKMYF